MAGAGFALLFLFGQILAWRQLNTAGYFLAGNPANAFFYLLVALHGLHLSGGLLALGRCVHGVWRGNYRRDRVRHNVALCAAYWHFLLFVWLCLLVLFTGWAADLVNICRSLLS